MMANLEKIIYMSATDFATMINEGSVTIDGKVYTYSQNIDYRIKTDIVKDVKNSSGQSLVTDGVATVPDSPVKGAKVEGGYSGNPFPIIDGYIMIPRATADLGLVKSDSSYGMTIVSNGQLRIVKANDNELLAKNSEYKPIVSANLDKAVMEGLGNNSLTWSDTYKQSARNTIEALGYDDVIDNVTSTTTDKPLSAKQGKLLNDRIDDLSNIGKFLSLWDSTTGLPDTDPTTMPYTYTTGDYYRVTKIATQTGEKNYKPTGSSYDGTASTVEYTGEIGVGDIWFYDGTTWQLQINHLPDLVQDVQVAGGSVVSGGIANIPKASDSTLGVVRTQQSTYGIGANADGKLYIVAPTDTDIVNKTASTKAITPNKLDKAVLEGLGNNGLTMTAQYQSNARDFIGCTLIDEHDGWGDV